MKTKGLLGLIWVVLLNSLFVHSGFSQSMVASEQKPNIVIIFTDDHRYDAIQALGNKDVKTPNIDRIIKSGVTFTNAYLQGANTAATCVASRAQLLTGRGVFQIPGGKGPFPATMTSFPMAFKEGGYFTFITGKSHNGPEASMRGFMGGAKLYGLSKGYYRPHFRMPYQDFREDGMYDAKLLYFVGGENHELKVDPESNPDYVGPHSSEIFATAAVNFLKTYDRDQPFLLYLPFHGPHDKRIAPPEYHSMYPSEQMKLFPNFLPEHPFDNGHLEIRDEKLAPFPRTVKDTQKQISDYYAIITHLDAQIGRVLETLEQRGYEKNTIIVFVTDSGLGMGSHGLFGKQNLYDDAGIHVPIVIAGPGIPKNQRREDLCYTFDIFPTLCALTGVPVPNSVTGKSLAKSVLQKGIDEGREELYFAYTNFQRAIRDKRHKLIEYCVRGERHAQLFDLKKDPYEISDLAGNPEYAKTLRDLKGRLISHQQDEAEWGNRFWENYPKQAGTQKIVKE